MGFETIEGLEWTQFGLNGSENFGILTQWKQIWFLENEVHGIVVGPYDLELGFEDMYYLSYVEILGLEFQIGFFVFVLASFKKLSILQA